MNKESHEIKPTPLNHYFNYKVNYGEAIIFFFLTIIGGQFIGGIFSLLMLAFPVLTDVLLPMSFLFGFGFAAAIIMVLKKLKPTELNHFFSFKNKHPSFCVGHRIIHSGIALS